MILTMPNTPNSLYLLLHVPTLFRSKDDKYTAKEIEFLINQAEKNGAIFAGGKDKVILQLDETTYMYINVQRDGVNAFDMDLYYKDPNLLGGKDDFITAHIFDVRDGDAKFSKHPLNSFYILHLIFNDIYYSREKGHKIEVIETRPTLGLLNKLYKLAKRDSKH
jgi:hypothetical protein